MVAIYCILISTLAYLHTAYLPIVTSALLHLLVHSSPSLVLFSSFVPVASIDIIFGAMISFSYVSYHTYNNDFLFSVSSIRDVGLYFLYSSITRFHYMLSFTTCILSSIRPSGSPSNNILSQYLLQ